MDKNSTKIFQFKIELSSVSPSIWRRIQIKSCATFWDLHCAIQCSMGWDDCHLHCFEIKNPLNGKFVRIGKPIEKGEPWSLDEARLQGYMHNPHFLVTLQGMGVGPKNDGRNMFASWKAPLSKYYSQEFSHYQTEYTYDFGDNWILQVDFEGKLDSEPERSYPVCVDGERAGPPEDCCGIYGFEELKINLKKSPDQRTEEEKEKIEWLSDTMGLPDYDPEFFDPSKVIFMNPATMLQFRKTHSLYGQFKN